MEGTRRGTNTSVRHENSSALNFVPIDGFQCNFTLISFPNLIGIYVGRRSRK